MRKGGATIIAGALAAFTAASDTRAQGQGGLPPNLPSPIVRADQTIKLSEHVYAIPDGGIAAVPNIGIVVGTRASLVMDTGLGQKNGQTVARELAKVSRNATVYLAATHFHPEHLMGESAFPPSSISVRSRAQQQDVDQAGKTIVEFFTKIPSFAEHAKAAVFRPPDILFDRELDIDLGGVRVTLMSLGPAHTAGDVGLFVHSDGILFTGDVAMNTPLAFNPDGTFSSAPARATAWLESLERLAALRPSRVVPSHGAIGDASIVNRHLEVMLAIRARVAELKRQGRSIDETLAALVPDMEARFPAWAKNENLISNVVRAFYTELP